MILLNTVIQDDIQHSETENASIKQTRYILQGHILQVISKF